MANVAKAPGAFAWRVFPWVGQGTMIPAGYRNSYCWIRIRTYIDGFLEWLTHLVVVWSSIGYTVDNWLIRWCLPWCAHCMMHGLIHYLAMWMYLLYTDGLGLGVIYRQDLHSFLHVFMSSLIAFFLDSCIDWFCVWFLLMCCLCSAVSSLGSTLDYEYTHCVAQDYVRLCRKVCRTTFMSVVTIRAYILPWSVNLFTW